MISIVDYGVGNLASVRNMLKKVGYNSIVTNSAQDILNSSHIILPGVGSFDSGMKALRSKGELLDVINHVVKVDKKPVLGICLGMQLMTKGSDEGIEAGLSWIDADVKSLRGNIPDNFKVPHMGWNNITDYCNSKLSRTGSSQDRFYFVHSYYVKCNKIKDILFTTEYGIEFTVGFKRENIIGVQFHPEKSHKFGMSFFKNFIEGNL